LCTRRASDLEQRRIALPALRRRIVAGGRPPAQRGTTRR
jgi:hypothetical protein